MSTVARELIVLSSYTIHHFALIAITLKEPGLTVDPDFGVANSTLRNCEAQHSSSSGGKTDCG